jgi:hypothetical protein
MVVRHNDYTFLMNDGNAGTTPDTTIPATIDVAARGREFKGPITRF